MNHFHYVLLLMLCSGIMIDCSSQEGVSSPSSSAIGSNEEQAGENEIKQMQEEILNLAKDSANKRVFMQNGMRLTQYVAQQEIQSGVFHVKEVVNIYRNEAQSALECTLVEYVVQTENQSQRFPILEYQYISRTDTAFEVKRRLTEFQLDTIWKVPLSSGDSTDVYQLSIYDLMHGQGQQEAIYQKYWLPEEGTVVLANEKQPVLKLVETGSADPTLHRHIMTWLSRQHLLTE